MAAPLPGDLTGLLQAWRAGDDGAFGQLTELVHGELRRLAHARMRGEDAGHILQTTDLVHEAYVRLVDARGVSWQDPTHFFAVCAQAMRRILVDAARSRGSFKRGGHARRVPFDEGLAVAGREVDLVALDDALTDLGRADPRKGRIGLRYFGGLNVEETGEALGISAQTVMRDWKMAKLWLLKALRESRDGGRRDRDVSGTATAN
jgi:RNA polymerase sigma factor (TIGR02999 family)